MALSEADKRYNNSEKGKATNRAGWRRFAATEKGKARSARYRKSPARQISKWRWWLKTKYGITPEVYDARLIEQNGVCALCPRTPAEERFKRLEVDHCHTTMRFRGLLCKSCNTSIGKLGDDEAGLLRALEYIRG
jgi:hypothetical protein